MIKAIIGLGNPGAAYYHTRHSIGFRVVDALAEKLNAQWRPAKKCEIAEGIFNDQRLLLVKSTTFMNNSGELVPELRARNITPEEILVVHDELELPFGKIAYKKGGSAKGHNGLKSLIAAMGDQFDRLRVGIGRPENREEVPDYVLEKFSEKPEEIERMIEEATNMCEHYVSIQNQKG